MAFALLVGLLPESMKAHSAPIRWTAIITLTLGLVLAVASGWLDEEAYGSMSEAHARSATAVSSRMFAVGAVFIVLTLLELQHSKTVARLKELEEEIAMLRRSPVGLRG